MLVTLDVTHNYHWKERFASSFSFFLPYLCLHTVCLVRMEVVCVYFDVLFFISEFHFLFLLIFILFWLACIYVCCWCFPLGVYFNVCLIAYLFRLYSLFVFIYCLCYVTTLSFFLWKYILLSNDIIIFCLFIDWLYALYSVLKISRNILCII